jgi:tyrosyl-tRNA synthetase
MTDPAVQIPTDAEIHALTTRAVADIIPRQEFIDALKSGRRLRLKQGFDPTRPDLTLGHAVGLRKLRALQEYGHEVVLIVGDWTARIGDPSGQSATRPMLTEAEVNANAESYLRQFFSIVDRERTEVRHQTEWFDRFTLEDVVRLTSKFTVAQMLQRDDFAKRLAEHRPIAVTEFLYPLMQAYDSTVIHSDVEFGGTDQRFNNLLGRELQEAVGQRGQSVFLVPLLVGTDGQKKMSKSLGNYIALEEPPDEMFGKVMSLPDNLIADYFELVTDVPNVEVAEIRRAVESGVTNPMDLKKRLAAEIVRQFHDNAAANEALANFERVFQRRELPDDMPSVPIGETPLAAPALAKIAAEHLGWNPSTAELKRLIQQGGLEVNQQRITSPKFDVRPGDVVRLGKHRFFRVGEAQE